MNKNYLIQLAGYNRWANAIAHTWLEQLTDEQWERPIVSSFSSIASTTIHTAGAEKAWLERMQQLPFEQIVPLATTFKGTKKEAITIWDKASAALEAFTKAFDENKLATTFSFKRFNGEAYTEPYYQVLMHVFNHSTYHRGQLVTMLRQAGFTNVTSTDLLQYFSK